LQWSSDLKLEFETFQCYHIIYNFDASAFNFFIGINCENTSESPQEQLEDQKSEDGSDFHDSEYEISDDDVLFEVHTDEGIESGMSTKCKEKGTKSLLMASGNNEVNSDYEE
jgi:hypothetical protein